MGQDKEFAERLARINDNKASQPAAPQPARKTSHRRAAKTPKPFRNILFGLAGIAVMIGLTWNKMDRPTENVFSPFAGLEERKKVDSKFERCTSDPKLLKKLADEGHTNPKYAAMLLCG